jgi:tRNA dimethylallyltransferase
MKTVFVITGPTGSGKSGLALALAERMDGCVINADSMQVYDLYPRLSAQPTMEERRGIPHLLYSHITPPDFGTAERWADDAAKAIQQCFDKNQTPLLTGGSGMYLEFLMHGRSAIPDVPEEDVKEAREAYEKLGGAALLEKLKTVDASAAKLNPGDPSRVIRAYSVYLATGKGIGDWQKETFEPPRHNWNYKTICLLPERKQLYTNLNTRFEKMITAGALDEVRTAMERNIPDDHLAHKAHGAPELRKVLRGEWSLEEAISHAQQVTRNYAKRQFTWFRNRFTNKEKALHRPFLSLESADIVKNTAEALDFGAKA